MTGGRAEPHGGRLISCRALLPGWQARSRGTRNLATSKSTSARHRARTRLPSPGATIRAAPVRARKTAAMKWEAGRWILELPGPNHRTGKASVYNALRASPRDDRPDFRRGIHAAGTPTRTQRSTAIAKPAGSDSPPKRRAVANNPGEAMPSGPAKTGAPDARSGARKGLPERIHVPLTSFTVQKPCSAQHSSP